MKSLFVYLTFAACIANIAISQSECSDYYACNYNPLSFDNTTDCVYPASHLAQWSGGGQKV